MVAWILTHLLTGQYLGLFYKRGFANLLPCHSSFVCEEHLLYSWHPNGSVACSISSLRAWWKCRLTGPFPEQLLCRPESKTAVSAQGSNKDATGMREQAVGSHVSWNSLSLITTVSPCHPYLCLWSSEQNGRVRFVKCHHWCWVPESLIKRLKSVYWDL